MPIITNLEERLMQAVLTLYRRVEPNVMAETYRAMYRLADAFSQAVEEFITTSYPLATAPGWVLDQHWGPKFNVPRNGLSDSDYRLYIQAQILLILSAGHPDEVLRIIRLLLPTATSILFTPFYPKAWHVEILGVDLATAEPVLRFLSTAPSPQGGGFATAGENGIAVSSDAEVLSFSSTHGAVTIAGFFSSVYGASGGVEAGYAHATQI